MRDEELSSLIWGLRHSRTNVYAEVAADYIEKLLKDNRSLTGYAMQYDAVRNVLKDHGCVSNEQVVYVPGLVEDWAQRREERTTKAEAEVERLRNCIDIARQRLLLVEADMLPHEPGKTDVIRALRVLGADTTGME